MKKYHSYCTKKHEFLFYHQILVSLPKISEISSLDTQGSLLVVEVRSMRTTSVLMNIKNLIYEIY